MDAVVSRRVIAETFPWAVTFLFVLSCSANGCGGGHEDWARGKRPRSKPASIVFQPQEAEAQGTDGASQSCDVFCSSSAGLGLWLPSAPESVSGRADRNGRDCGQPGDGLGLFPSVRNADAGGFLEVAGPNVLALGSSRSRGRRVQLGAPGRDVLSKVFRAAVWRSAGARASPNLTMAGATNDIIHEAGGTNSGAKGLSKRHCRRI